MRRIALALVLGATAPAAAQESATALARFEPASAVLVEDLRERAQISGSLVAGVMRAGIPTAESPRLAARVPGDWAGATPCVRVISADGLYVAETPYAVPAGWENGNAIFAYESRHAEVIRERYSGDPTSAATIAREPCSEEPRTFVPAFWNVEPAQDETIVLHINSASADRVYLFAGSDPAAQPIGCTQTAADRRIGYDFTCVLSVPPGIEALDIELNRVRNGTNDTPRLFRIVLP